MQEQGNKVLILNPTERKGFLFVPYLWLCLKSHHQEFGRSSDKWAWIEPIADFDYLSFNDLIEKIISEKPQVLGLSYYLWNAKLNFALAEAVKKELPQITIIAGGPHLNHRADKHWFSKNPAVDLICDPDIYGEEFMTELLDQLAEGTVDYSSIPGSIYPASDRMNYERSALKPDKRKFKWPQYTFKDSENYLSALNALANLSQKKLILTWESNRGCPYGCAYCEWGGGIMSKMSMKPMETIRRELDFLKAINLHTLHINDANFGILDRDLEIAEILVELAKTNKLQRVWLGGKNKNDKKRVEEIDHLFLTYGLGADGYQISINALHEAELKAINRTELPIKDHLEMVRKVRAEFDIDTDLELIMGLPCSSPSTMFLEFDIFDEGDLWRTERFPFALLPETPASRPEYKEKYKLRTVKASAQIDDSWVQYKDLESVYNLMRDPKYLSEYDMVIETISYSPEEWMEMIMLDNFVRAMECSGFLTDIRLFLKEHSNLRASAFYEKVWKKFRQREEILPLKAQIQKFLNEEPGHQESYLWFKHELDPKNPIKMEAFFNLVVLNDPGCLFDSVRKAFPERTELLSELIDKIQMSVDQSDILLNARKLLVKKVLN